MEFVAGKFYRTKGGDAESGGWPSEQAVYLGVNPLATDPTDKHVFALKCGDTFSTGDDGQIYAGRAESRWDIIGEWQDPVTVTTFLLVYIRPNGGDEGRDTFKIKSNAIEVRQNLLSNGYRVGPIEEITTVVP